ncbi:MAG: hypothetical protein ACR2MB_11855 [Acidimicrobiales bacterium]
MSLTANCPTCTTLLTLTSHGSFDSWVCPKGHGLAATLSELYERAQEDEVHRLWELVRHTSAGTEASPCPMCTRPMVSVTVPTDEDEAAEGQPGDTPDTGEVAVEVCAADEVIWFDAGELEGFPADLPDAQPTPEQEAAVATIARTFTDDVAASWTADPDLADRILNRLGRSPQAAGLLHRGIVTAR